MGQMRKEAKPVGIVSAPIRVVIRADRALFTRPEMTVERYSYDVPTISAMKGVLRSIFNHDGMDYRILNIYVCRKIVKDMIMRNETKLMQSVTNPQKYLFLKDSSTRVLRGTTFLVNVEYVVEAEIVMRPARFGSTHTLEQFYDMFSRRLDKGGNQRTPWLGAREFPCFVKPLNSACVKSVYAGKTLDLGIMYQDIAVDDNGTAHPIFAKTTLENGKICYCDWFSDNGLVASEVES